MKVLKRLVILVIAVVVAIGMISTYRAWYQVKSLELHSDSTLRPGSVVETNAASYGRTPVDVRVELVQDSHTEILVVYTIRANEWGFFDPRVRHSSRKLFLTQGVLGGFQPGKATLRATATGVEQWTRLPPPIIREMNVEITSP